MPAASRFDDLESVEALDERIASAMRLVLHDLSRRVTRSEAAARACLDESYFSKRFRDVVCIGFKSWSTVVRIEVSCELLTGTGLHVAQIAERLGYEDGTTFQRNFKRYVGCSPREFRKGARKHQKVQTSERTKRRVSDTFRRL